MQEIPAKQNAMRLPFFCPGFLSLGRGVSEFSNGNGGLLFHLRRNQLLMLEPPSKNSTPPPQKKNGQDWPLQSYHNFSNLRGGSKRPIRWYQNQGGYSDVPLGCKQMLHCQSFLQIAEHLKMNLLEMLQVVPISGRFYRCKHVSWPQVVRQGRSSGQTALIRRCAELA